jgi:hypothetical protein
MKNFHKFSVLKIEDFKKMVDTLTFGGPRLEQMVIIDKVGNYNNLIPIFSWSGKNRQTVQHF